MTAVDPGWRRGMRPGGRACKGLPVLALAVLLSPAAARERWSVPEAEWRFELQLENDPTHAEAGYFVHLPDGGVLPGPCPVTHVTTPDGRPVDSYVLWHNPVGGLGVVFASPGPVGRVWVYVTGEEAYRLWRPDSGLKPSMILCTDPARGTMAAARQMGMMGRVGETVHYRQHPGRSNTPISIAGDPSGRPRPSSFYLLAHVTTRDPGRTWIAPFSADGDSEVQINGQRITPRRRNDNWAGSGQWVTLPEGLHRVEVHAAVSGPEVQGHVMFLTWRTPNAVIPYENAEAQPIRNHEVVRSGSASLLGLHSSHGVPAAVIRAEPREVFWFGDEIPLVAYRFRALTEGHPDDTEYLWHFEDGGRPTGDTLRWILPGHREYRVRLETGSSRGRTAAVRTGYAFSTFPTSLDQPLHRRAFREGLSTMLSSYPARNNPVPGWERAYWNTLLRTLDFGRGYPMLAALFDQHADTLRARLDAGQAAMLQDIFLDQAPRVDAQRTLQWIERFQQESRSLERRGLLGVRAAEVMLYYLEDNESAALRLTDLVRDTDMPASVRRLARIRLGDVSLLEGRIDHATRYYAEEQESRAIPLPSVMEGLFEMFAVEPLPEPPTPRRRGRGHSAATAPRVEAWKMSALYDAALSDGIGRLIEEGHWLDAKRALEAWEWAMPLAKLGSDFLIQEARLYRAAGDAHRALVTMRAYTEHMDAAAYLPAAAQLVLGCMADLEMPAEALRAAGAELLKRLEFHPAADKLRFTLERLP